MASVSVDHCLNAYEILNPFRVFVSQIAQELVILDVKIIKSVLTGIVAQSFIDKFETEKESSAVELFSELQRLREISPNNLELLKELLTAIRNFKLLDKVEEFEKTSVKTLDDAGKAQMEAIQQVSDLVELFLVLSCKHGSLTVNQIDQLKEKVKEASGLRLSQIQYNYSSENECDENTTLVAFQFINDLNLAVTDKLQECANKKEQWLKDNGVLLLKVNGNSSINVKEPVKFKPKDAEEEIVLAMKPELQPYHAKNMVDLILVVEMPQSVKPGCCKQVLDECQFAINILAETHLKRQIDMKLAVVHFENGSFASTDPAFIIQNFCDDFSDVKNKLKERVFGSKKGDRSGMGAALAKVLELSRDGSMRKEASKVCIMTSFLPKKQDLDHFKCPDNDIIKLSHLLAKAEIPLYVLGVHEKEIGNQSGNIDVEEYFLPGVTHIGGGGYFTIPKDQIAQMNKVITAIVNNEVSIENFGETNAKVFKDALDNNFGDVNVDLLAKDLTHDLRFEPLKKIEKLQHGVLHAIAKRVAFSDDIAEAIATIRRMKKEHSSYSSQNRGAPLSHLLLHRPWEMEEVVFVPEGGEYDGNEESKQADVLPRADVAKMPQNVQEKLSPEQIDHLADLEMAGRIVRRYFYRMAYYKKKP